MKICSIDRDKIIPTWVRGNLYKHEDGEIYLACIYVGKNILVSVTDGSFWSNLEEFAGKDYKFSDVTEEYCLKRIK